jgi:hypothetical protein
MRIGGEALWRELASHAAKFEELVTAPSSALGFAE